MISVGIRSLMTAKNESELDSVVLKALLENISIAHTLMIFFLTLKCAYKVKNSILGSAGNFSAKLIQEV